MINKIIDAISLSINSEFGQTYDIYTESIEQGLKEPCFSIFCIKPTNELFRNDRYFRTNLFGIQYFPSTKTPKQECNDVLERLYGCLEMIEIQENINLTSIVRGSRLNGELVNGVLNFFVNYNMFVERVEVNTPMEEITTFSKAKG